MKSKSFYKMELGEAIKKEPKKIEDMLLKLYKQELEYEAKAGVTIKKAVKVGTSGGVIVGKEFIGRMVEFRILKGKKGGSY